MKKFKYITISLAAFFLFQGILLQAQVKVTGHISAEVITTLSAKETAQLNFGRFSPQTAGGQVIMTPEGAQVSTGTVTFGTGVHNSASFYVSGETGTLFTITLPNAPVNLTNTANSKTMKVSNWVSVPQQSMGVVLPEGGSKVVTVGATLKVGTIYDNPVGIYTGTYAITFSYN